MKCWNKSDDKRCELPKCDHVSFPYGQKIHGTLTTAKTRVIYFLISLNIVFTAGKFYISRFKYKLYFIGEGKAIYGSKSL